MGKIRFMLLFLFVFGLISFFDKGYAEETNVSLDISLSGNGSNEGIFQYQMARMYTNQSNETQTFSESFHLGMNNQMNVGFVHLVNKSEVLIFDHLGDGAYQISGTLEPSEVGSITIYKNSDGLGRGGSSNATVYGDRLNLLSRRDNLMIRSLNIHFHYPSETLRISEFSRLNVITVNEKIDLPPSRDELTLVTDSWYVENGDEFVKEDDLVKKVDFKQVEGVYLDLGYEFRLNTTPPYLLYLALGLASLSMLYSVLLSVRMNRLKL